MNNIRAYLISAIVVLAGCASNGAQPKPEVVTPHYEVELETMEDQANSAVNATPTTFSVNAAAEDQMYWARASLFFKQYTDSFKVQKNTVRSVPGEKSRFIYEVSRLQKADGTTYTVKCESGGHVNTTSAVLSLNAKNFARFIREGNLELSLLQR